MRLNHDQIARLLPHTGAMVLLDSVLDYDAERIHCIADPHVADHPLREAGRLPAWCGIEYAAQAMAVHSGLCTATPSLDAGQQGFLAVARDIVMAQPELDGLPGEIDIHAEKIFADSGRSLYAFRLESQGQLIVSGRATVVLQARGAS
jgi:predicted hotdog family 3-hydroxylacyl-ACP dehydratase